MIWLALPSLIILAVRFTVAMVNLLSRPFLKRSSSEVRAMVSVLIPVRNEEHTLPALLDGLLEQEYDAMEILIYNDESTDGTQDVIDSYAGRHAHIRSLEGCQLPEGWSGKNHACHQLSMEARGTYFLYLDADVEVRPDLVSRSVSYLRDHDLVLLSLFPKQLMHSFGERLTVPVMHWILLSLLPLRLIRRSHYPALSAANGQFMLFRAREYRQHRFHRLVKGINVEDIHIIRKVKQMGYLADTLLSGGEISCRMYRSFQEGVKGFTRSMFTFFGGSGVTVLIFALFSTFGFLFVWLGISPRVALIYICMAMCMRTLIFLLSKQPVLISLLLSPLMQGSFLWILVTAFSLRTRGLNTWKGRVIKFKG